MKGVDWNHPECIRTIEELEQYIEEVGFLSLFANDVEGFSVESWQRIYDHVKEMYEEADESAIVKLIGKKPEE